MGTTRFQRPASPGPQPPSSTARGRTWRGIKFVVGGPVAALSVGDIRRGAGFIQRCASLVRNGADADPLLIFGTDGCIDIARTARARGISEPDLVVLILHRRHQTKIAAYLTASFGFLSIVFWFVLALRMPLMFSRVLSALEFLPFGLMFFLVAFKNAWTNWQLRTLRLGSAVEFLSTTDSCLPT